MDRKLVFRIHAVNRMFQRQISRDDVRGVLSNGITVEDYPEDTPYPSRLILGFCGDRPLHVVAADNDKENEIVVITVYEPDPALWDSDFVGRKTK